MTETQVDNLEKSRSEIYKVGSDLPMDGIGNHGSAPVGHGGRPNKKVLALYFPSRDLGSSSQGVGWRKERAALCELSGHKEGMRPQQYLWKGRTRSEVELFNDWKARHRWGRPFFGRTGMNRGNCWRRTWDKVKASFFLLNTGGQYLRDESRSTQPSEESRKDDSKSQTWEDTGRWPPVGADSPQG